MSSEQWSTATACPGWTVKDVAAHVLGDDVGRLARTRDGFTFDGPRPEETLPSFLDRINDQWVSTARRISPTVLVDLLEWTGVQIEQMWASLPPGQPSEPVSWAGPQVAPVWLDAARDFTEYWVHRQQIAEAVGDPVDADMETRSVVIDTFLRALPFTLRLVERPPSTNFTFVVEDIARAWTVTRAPHGWEFTSSDPTAANSLSVDSDTTWRLATRGIRPDAALRRAVITGDEAIAHAAATILSIIRSD